MTEEVGKVKNCQNLHEVFYEFSNKLILTEVFFKQSFYNFVLTNVNFTLCFINMWVFNNLLPEIPSYVHHSSQLTECEPR